MKLVCEYITYYGYSKSCLVFIHISIVNYVVIQKDEEACRVNIPEHSTNYKQPNLKILKIKYFMFKYKHARHIYFN